MKKATYVRVSTFEQNISRQLVEKHGDIVNELNKGKTIRRTAKFTDKSKSTVQRVKKALDSFKTTN